MSRRNNLHDMVEDNGVLHICDVSTPGDQFSDTEAIIIEDTGSTEISKTTKYIKTFFMVFTYLGTGFTIGAVSPSTVDMAELHGCTVEQFVRVSSAKPIGLLLGSFTGAIIADKFGSRADFNLFLCNFFGGLTFLLVAFSPWLWLMSIFFLLNGIVQGTINIVCTTINFKMWKEAAGTPLHIMHMCVTLGMTLAPLITAPFLSGESSNLNDTSSYAMSGNTSSTLTPKEEYSGHVRIAYTLFSIWSMSVSVIFLFFAIRGDVYVSKSTRRNKTFKEMIDPSAIAQGSFKFGLTFVLCLFFIYIFINGRDRAFSMYLFIIAHTDVLQLSKSTSAALVTVTSLGVVLGRGLGALISGKVPIQVMLFTELILGAYLHVLLWFYGLVSVPSLFVICGLLGFVTGPTYPSVMAWADRYIEATGVVISVIDVGLGLGGFASLWLSAYLYDEHGAVGVFTLGLVLAIFLIAIIAPLQIVSHMRGDRHKKEIAVPSENERY